MSAATLEATEVSRSAPGPREDIPGIGFGRLVHVELRKLVDTRAGRWLIIAIGLITAAVMAVMLFTGDRGDLTFENFTLMSAIPQGVLLPVLGILAVTSEWSQRTGLVTFTLEPRRGRVAAAKLLAAGLVGLLAVALAFAVGALANLVGMVARDGAGSWHFGGAMLAGAVLLQVIGVAQGVAFGMLLLNTPAAIVAYFALPMAWSIAGGLVSALSPVADWLDLSRTTAPLIDGGLAGQDGLKLAASVGVWVVLPLAVGVWRLLRREVK
jgi:ABC-type transport system involved in multi-copper enzyme maturation permease subunit